MSIMHQKMMILIQMIFGMLAVTTCVESTYHVEREHTCDCVCRDSFMDAAYTHKPLCHVISRFEKELLTVKQEIERRIVFINDVAELKEIMEEQEDMIKTLQDQVEKLSSTRILSESLPTPASLIMREDFMQGDSNKETRMKEEKDLANNVSTLIAKVEEVENLTCKVQEELRSERRVRRHLEEDLNETRSSIKMLDDKLLNVTLPMDSRVTHVEEIMLSTLENMNKTLFEDHLKKLYYKVDGVVYKNETEKLDERLDQVETELNDVNNINMTLKFSEELNNLTEILTTINQTIMEKLAEEEYRLVSLENKTTKLDELEGLQDQMSDLLNKTTKLDEVENFQDQIENLLNKTTKLEELEELRDLMAKVLNDTVKLDELEKLQDQMSLFLNVTDLMQRGAIDMWMDIQNVRNTTFQLEKEFYNQSTETSKAIEFLQHETATKLQALSEGLSSLKSEVLSDQASLRNLQTDLHVLSADVAVSESKLLNLSMTSDKMMKEISTKIENLTGVWDNSLSTLAGQIEKWKNSKGTNSGSENSKYITQNKNNEDWGETDEDEEVDIVRMRRKDSDEQKRCDLPPINDEHLLMALQNDTNGVDKLVFGCQPLGQYVLEEGTVTLECKDGSWDKDPPKCSRLKTESEIIASNYAEKLENVIPTIFIEPDNVDRPFGLMGTSNIGHLIVYPNTNFQLHCLFPENQLGHPIWEAEQYSLGFPYRMPSRNFKHKSTIEFDSITSIYNGIYTCITPYNKRHAITITVEAVKCPAFQVDSEREKALIYNGHPDGGERVLSTTAKFLCEDGSSISAMCLSNGTWSRAAPTVEECPPKRYRYRNLGPQRRTSYRPKHTTSYQRYRTIENMTHFELQVSKPGSQYKRTHTSTTRTRSRSHGTKIWGCDVYTKQSVDDPEVMYDNVRHEIRFICPGARRLVGSAVATCINNSWTLSSFPKCI